MPSHSRTRDYKAEYRRRITSAFKRGLTRSQARGHAKRGEIRAIDLRKGTQRIAQLAKEGKVKPGNKEYLDAVRELSLHPDSPTLDAQAQILAMQRGYHIKYAYSVLLGSP
jgi:hypothetical protein